MPGISTEIQSYDQETLPTLRTSIRLEGAEVYDTRLQQTAIKSNANGRVIVWDVKFCPFIPPDLDPIFAVVAVRSVTICRAVARDDTLIEIVNTFLDDDKSSAVEHNSVAWAQDPVTKEPLILISGSLPNIKAINVITGEVKHTLIGHGGGVNDIIVSPTSPSTIATCSQDYSIRLWNLKPEYAKFPCSVICVGQGHKASVVSIDFHSNGRYLLSAGYDTYIHLWALPEAEELENLPRIGQNGREEAKSIHFPYFSTADLHSNYIDCVKFYGDLIISRAVKEDTVLLWKINGFSSANPIPSAPPTETNPDLLTKSAFGEGFQRLMQFDAKDTGTMWMRFGLFNAPGQHPILAMGNYFAEVFFWDLQKLEAHLPDLHGFDGKVFKGVEPHGKLVANRWASRAHKRLNLVRAIGWSPDGRWCVVGGENGMLLISSRWTD